MKARVIPTIAVLLWAGVHGLSAAAAIPTKLNSFPEGERLVFARVVSAYRANKTTEAKRQRDVLARNYPRSIHLGHAYYLSGVLEYQNGNLAEAVRNFGVVTDRYPQSRKRSSAMFAKAATYDRLNLRPLAVRLWQEIAREYPGSQEAQRAQAQLQLQTLATKKR